MDQDKPPQEGAGQEAVQVPASVTQAEARAAEPEETPKTEVEKPTPAAEPAKGATPEQEVTREAPATTAEPVAPPPTAAAPPAPVVAPPPAPAAPADPPAPAPAPPAAAVAKPEVKEGSPAAAGGGGVVKPEAPGDVKAEEVVTAPQAAAPAQPAAASQATVAGTTPAAAATPATGASGNGTNQAPQHQTGGPPLATQAEAPRVQAQPQAPGQQQAAFLQQQQALAQRAAQQASQGAVQAAQRPGQQTEAKGSEGAGEEPRRASGRPNQAAKNQDDYFSDSPPDSPNADEERKPDPAKPKSVAKPAQSVDDSQVSGWEEPPKKQLCLKISDLTKRLEKKWLQIFWPDDGKWWPCQVALVDIRKKTATLIYETGEEEADLELAELIAKGEVAWLHESDAPKEAMSSGRRGGRPPASWKSDDYDDEPAPSRGRGKAQDDDDYDEEEDEEPYEPGRKRKAAVKSKARYRETDEASYSSDSDSPPPSDQSSDWHSSDEDDKPKRKPKKKKKKTNVPRAQYHSHQSQQQAHPRQHPAAHGHSSQPIGGSNVYGGRNSIFNDDGPSSFGSAFGGVGDQNSHRNSSMGRDNMQGFSVERNWSGPGSTGNAGSGSYPAGWGRGQGQASDVNQLLQRQQQMGGAGMGQLHIPQVSMQNAGNLFANNQLARLNPAQGLQGWRGGAPGGMDWAASQNLFRMPGQQQPQISQQLGGLPQMSQQMGLPQQLSQQQQMLMHQQYLQQQRAALLQQQAAAAAQQQQQQGQQPTSQAPQQQQPLQAAPQRPAVAVHPVIAASATKNMEGLVAQGMNGTGRQVEVQQTDGSWVKGTVMTSMAKEGGSVIVSLETNRQAHLLAAEEGKTFNIRTTS